MPLGFGFGLGVRGRRGGAGGGGAVTLAAEPAKRGALLSANAINGIFQSWDNDPPTADRVGYYALGAPGSALLPRAFGDIFTFSRASKAWDVDAFGLWSEHAVNGVRQGYGTTAPAGWLLEGAAQNSVRNSRGEGAAVGVLGSGGAWPTFWTGGGPGLTVEIVGKGVEDGLAYTDIRISGIPTLNGGSYYTIGPDAGPGIVAAANGQVWVPSTYIRRISGPAPLYSRAYLRQYSAANGALADLFPAVTIPTTGTIGNCRVAAAAQTLNQATVASIGFFYQFGTLNDGTTAIDVVYRVAAPQLEQNYFASSVIFPPVGAPAAAVRVGDALSIGGSQFGAIFGSGAGGFVICDVLLNQAPSATASQPIVQVGVSNDASNRIILHNANGGSSVLATNINANVNIASPSAGSIVLGTVFRAGIRWGGGTNTAACMNGGAIQAAAGAAPAGMNELLIGRTPAAPLNGRLLGAWAGANGGAISDAAFQAACVLGADPVAVLA